MMQGFSAPRICGELPDSSRESPSTQPRGMIPSWHTIQRSSVSTVASSTMENDNTSFYYDHGALSAEAEEADVVGETQDAAKTYPDAHSLDKNAIHIPVALGSGQSLMPSPSAKEAAVAKQPKMDFADVYTPNIVVFGETGVGKSSVINLIAGRKAAPTSNGALGCTFQHERYTITLGNMSYALWDTTGLDEGSEGTVPAALAESNLRALIEELAHTGGIHLVIYCVRAGRVTKALQRNYHLFYVTVCRKKVPVALVVTGLEHQQGGMETWWNDNERDLRRSGMRFDAHACVTTLDVEDQIIRERRSDSQSRLCELVLEYSRLPPWRIEPSFVSWVLPKLRRVLRRTFSAGRPENTKTTRKVIVCDMAADSQTPRQLSPGITAVWQRFDGLIGDRHYEFVRVDERALQTPTSALQYVGGAGVLVFYTSALVDTGISLKDVDALKTFYDIAGGQTCPVIVVVRGCEDEEAVWMLWGDVTSRHSDIHAHVTFLPSTKDASDGQTKLNEVIESLCIEHVEVVPSGFSKASMTSKRFLAAVVEAVPEQFAHVTGFVTKRAKQHTPSSRVVDGHSASV